MNSPNQVSACGKYLIARLDPDNKVPESDELNNVVVFGPISGRAR